MPRWATRQRSIRSRTGGRTNAQYGSIILSVTDSIGNQYASSGWGNSMDYILDLDGVSTQLRPFGGLWNGQRLRESASRSKHRSTVTTSRAWNGSSRASSQRIEIHGTAIAVPEPGACAMLIVALVATTTMVWRRRGAICLFSSRRNYGGNMKRTLCFLAIAFTAAPAWGVDLINHGWPESFIGATSPASLKWEIATADDQRVVGFDVPGLKSGYYSGISQWSIRPETAAIYGLDWFAFQAAANDPLTRGRSSPSVVSSVKDHWPAPPCPATSSWGRSASSLNTGSSRSCSTDSRSIRGSQWAEHRRSISPSRRRGCWRPSCSQHLHLGGHDERRNHRGCITADSSASTRTTRGRPARSEV